MGLIANSGSNVMFKKVPAGVHIARCVQVIDLGTQEVTFQGETKQQHKLYIAWEVLGEDDAGVPLTYEGTDGKDHPMTIGKRYTLSLNDKSALRKDLAAWRGRDFTPEELKAFDISKLLGAYCMLNVQHNESNNGKTYANVASITPLPTALAKNKPTSDTKPVSFDMDDPDMALFDSFPPWLQDVIQASAEWAARSAPKAPPKPAPAKAGTAFDDMESDELDDVPF
ncbi:MAG: hypothetical protein KDI55_19260 [Anaerolineae bacterium]|nr:hypothetical protein [Anaerolineae bacterium]